MRSKMLVAGLLIVASLAAPGARESAKAEKLNGYAEYRHGDALVVDGQRVRVSAATKFKGKHARALDAIPLGYEVQVKGLRAADGAIVATEIEAKPNGSALFEKEVRQATDEIEATWLNDGVMFEPKDDGSRTIIGKTLDEGADVDRVRDITNRLLPPYVNRQSIRVHVVETKEWNAAAMGNGAVWVYTGLIDELSDDELAIILGHELAHYTHEHSRRGAKQALWTQVIALGAVAAAANLDSTAARTSAQVATLLSMAALSSGYSRAHEDQADRVGLRYAYEAGYDVTRGPGLWVRFQEKYGNGDKVTNFFFGGHSRPSDRIRNIERELAINYSAQR